VENVECRNWVSECGREVIDRIIDCTACEESNGGRGAIIFSSDIGMGIGIGVGTVEVSLSTIVSVF
jgi:hypothetical protein